MLQSESLAGDARHVEIFVAGALIEPTTTPAIAHKVGGAAVSVVAYNGALPLYDVSWRIQFDGRTDNLTTVIVAATVFILQKISAEPVITLHLPDRLLSLALQEEDKETPRHDVPDRLMRQLTPLLAKVSTVNIVDRALSRRMHRLYEQAKEATAGSGDTLRRRLSDPSRSLP